MKMTIDLINDIQENVTVQLVHLWLHVWQIQLLQLVLEHMEVLQLFHQLLQVQTNFPIEIVATLSNIFRKMWWGNLHTSSCLYDRSNLCFLYWNLWRCSNVTFSSCRFRPHFPIEIVATLSNIFRKMWWGNLHTSSCLYDRSNLCFLYWNLWRCSNVTFSSCRSDHIQY